MRRGIVLLVAPLLLLSLLPEAVSAGGPRGQAQSRAQVLAYWTPARMAPDRPAARHDAGHRADGPPGGGGGGSVTGRLVEGRGINDPITRATGKVYFEMDGGAGTAPAPWRRTPAPATRSC